MTASFPDLKTLAAERWPAAFVAEGDDAFAACVGDFAGTVADWRERSALYA